MLPKIINSDQTGFIPGRYIGEYTRLIYDIMHYTEENNVPGTLLMIDFEKAFDSVSWNFIQKSLQFYNFGPSFQKCNLVTQSKRKRKRSDSVLCQKPLHPQNNPKSNVTT